MHDRTSFCHFVMWHVAIEFLGFCWFGGRKINSVHLPFYSWSFRGKETSKSRHIKLWPSVLTPLGLREKSVFCNLDKLTWRPKNCENTCLVQTSYHELKKRNMSHALVSCHKKYPLDPCSTPCTVSAQETVMHFFISSPPCSTRCTWLLLWAHSLEWENTNN